MQIIGSEKAETVAAYDEKNKRLVIVTRNLDKSQNIAYDLSQFGRITDGTVSRWTTIPGDKHHYVLDKDLSVKSKSLSVTLNEKSVHTIEIDNVFIN